MGLNVKTVLDINIIGNYYNDFVLYFVRILQVMGKRVLIRDTTEQHSLWYSMPQVDGIDPNKVIYDYGGIGYTYLSGTNDDYDIVIRLFDTYRIPFVDGLTIIAVNESKKAVEELGSLRWKDFCADKREICLIIRNYTGIIKHQFDELMEKANIGRVFPIPIDVKDSKAAIIAEYETKYRFDNISARYKDALIEIVKLVEKDIDYKEISRYFKKAAGGNYKH